MSAIRKSDNIQSIIFKITKLTFPIINNNKLYIFDIKLIHKNVYIFKNCTLYNINSM